MDVSPYIKHDITLVPARIISENFGAKVTWDGSQRKVTIQNENTNIVLTIDSDIAYVNGKPVQLEYPAEITKDTTVIPLRFVSENLGVKVDWNNANREITLTLE
jgi:N-acetylmuramoyl-L-alanine amidase